MCIFNRPSAPRPDPAVEAERKERMEKELAETKSMKQKNLQAAVKTKERRQCNTFTPFW